MALTDAQKLARAKAENAKLKAQLASAGTDPAIIAERDTARTEVVRVTDELRQCGENRRRLEESLREAKDQLHEIALNARDFQRELETVTHERDSANKRIADLETRIREFETENRRLNGVLEGKNLRIAELEAKVSQEGIKFKLW